MFVDESLALFHTPPRNAFQNASYNHIRAQRGVRGVYVHQDVTTQTAMCPDIGCFKNYMDLQMHSDARFHWLLEVRVWHFSIQALYTGRSQVKETGRARKVAQSP